MLAGPGAVLFDFGGTLYDYRTLERANRESLIALARWSGIDAESEKIVLAHRDALRRTFHAYLPRSYYLHHDLFLDAVAGMLEAFGVALERTLFERYQVMLREAQERDLVLREGVPDTLRTLRERGILVGLVSNIDRDQLTYLSQAAGLSGHFDWMLSSEEARSCKPDLAIFEEAIRRTGCAPQETVFVGDTLAQDIAGANRVGMRSVLLWHRDDRSPPADGPRPRHIIRRIPELLEPLREI